MESIVLDCAPGAIRPWDLIEGVIEGTGTELPKERPTAFFGCATWEFDCPRDKWEAEIQPKVKARITALYLNGLIRYGGW